MIDTTGITDLLDKQQAFRAALLQDNDYPIASIEQDDDGAQFIWVRPSLIFPYDVRLLMSLSDGKPHVEFISGEDGVSHLLHNADSTAPLRIKVNDDTAHEDDSQWPKLVDTTVEDVQTDRLYRKPDASTIRRLWRAGRDNQRYELEVWYADGLGHHRVRVYGLGSKIGGWDDADKGVEDLELDRIVAAVLVETPEWRQIEDCTKCGEALFQHHETGKITDTEDTIYCVSPGAPGPLRGNKHSTDPTEVRIIK